MSAAVRQIQYIGGKSKRADTVAGTGLVWKAGEVLPVPFTAARKLAAHADIWQDVTDEPDQGAGFGSAIEQAAGDSEKDQLRLKVAELQEENYLLSEQVRQLTGATEDEPAPLPSLEAYPDIVAMRKDELAEYAGRELGLMFDPKVRVGDMRVAVALALEKRDGPIQADMLSHDEPTD